MYEEDKVEPVCCLSQNKEAGSPRLLVRFSFKIVVVPVLFLSLRAKHCFTRQIHSSLFVNFSYLHKDFVTDFHNILNLADPFER